MRNYERHPFCLYKLFCNHDKNVVFFFHDSLLLSVSVCTRRQSRMSPMNTDQNTVSGDIIVINFHFVLKADIMKNKKYKGGSSFAHLLRKLAMSS